MHIKTYLAALAALMAGCLGLPLKAQNAMKQNLSNKQQNLVALAAFEAQGNIDSLKAAAGRALDEGMTINEAKEALSHLYAYTGFPRSLNALGALEQTLAERQKQGRHDVEGRASSPLPKDFDALRQGTEVQTRLGGGRPFTYAFAPATDYYLKAHLFGDVFARDVLSPAERELVTLGALSALQGAESQLLAHVRGALNLGVSEPELRAVPAVLQERVGEAEAWRAAQAIARHFGEPFSSGRPVAHMMFPKGEPNTAYAQYFIGNSYLAPLLSEGLPVSNVTFEPRCRNNWHIHHKAEQILVCVGGEGWYQEWGKPARRLHEGNVVRIPAEVKHWHGATADSWFQHLSITVAREGASNEWLEPVADEAYDALP